MLTLLALTRSQAVPVSVYVPDWTVGVITNSTPTYQTSINPKYRMDSLTGTSNISKNTFANMAALNADHMRHVPWFPYPHLAVAQLEKPKKDDKGCNSGWDFTLIDPITKGLFDAVGKHPIVFNFATIPQWMWEGPNTYPDDPNLQDGSYEQGKALLDPTFQEVTGYFHKLASYYSSRYGEFNDECGVNHRSSIQNDLAWWEVLNEPDFEHGISPQYYTRIYDAIVSDLHKLLPNTKFLGLALGSHNNLEYVSYHLNRSNHQPNNIPLDGISYHQYIFLEGTIEAVAPRAFADMDTFVDEIIRIEDLKHRMEGTSGRVETFINEIGCGAGDSTWIQDGFFTLCAATYSYLFAKAAPLQVEHFGMSQVIGFTGKSLCDNCPTEWPSTSMVNWFTGDGNARYWVLKMMIDELQTGAKRAPLTYTTPSSIAYSQAFVTLNDNKKKILIVSKTKDQLEVHVDGATGGTVSFVDGTTGDQFGCAVDGKTTCYVKRRPLNSETFVLGPYGTAIVILP